MKCNFKAAIVPGPVPVKSGGPLCLQPKQDYIPILYRDLAGIKGTVNVIVTDEEESWSSKTNRFFHALVSLWYKHGGAVWWDTINAAPANLLEYREYVKVVYGGAYIEQLTRENVGKVSEMQEKNYALKKLGEKIYIIESWKAFTKRRACDTIDTMILEMGNAGIDIDKYVEEWRA